MHIYIIIAMILKLLSGIESDDFLSSSNTPTTRSIIVDIGTD